MKTKLLGLLTLLLAVSLASCNQQQQKGQAKPGDSTKRDHRHEQTTYSKPGSLSEESIKDAVAIKTIAGRTIEFQYTSTTGFYAELHGKKQCITFDEDSLTYQVKTDSGQFVSSGSYAYHQTGPSKADLIMISSSGMREMNKLDLTLRFTSKKEGTFNGKLQQGAVGRQRGKFIFVDS